MVGEYSTLLTIKFLKFVFIELTLSIAESSYTVEEDAGVLSVSVTVTGATDIIVTGRYVTFIDFCQEYNSSNRPSYLGYFYEQNTTSYKIEHAIVLAIHLPRKWCKD